MNKISFLVASLTLSSLALDHTNAEPTDPNVDGVYFGGLVAYRLRRIFANAKDLHGESNLGKRQQIAQWIVDDGNFLLRLQAFRSESIGIAKVQPQEAEVLQRFWIVRAIAAIFTENRGVGIESASSLKQFGVPHSDKPAEVSVVKALKEMQWW